MKDIIQGMFSFVTLFLIAGFVNAQNVQIGYPLHQELIPGQIAAYLQDGVTTDQARNKFSELGVKILRTEIEPVRATLYNPKKTVIEQMKNHPAIERYEMVTFVYDSTTLKNLKLADSLTEEEKEKARQQFLSQKDQTILSILLKEDLTSQEAEDALARIPGMGHFNLMTSQRIVYVEVEEGAESDQMEKIKSIPIVVNVTRVVKAVTLR